MEGEDRESGSRAFRERLREAQAVARDVALEYRETFRAEMLEKYEGARTAFGEMLEVAREWGCQGECCETREEANGPQVVVFEMLDLVCESLLEEFDARFGILGS